MVADRYVQSMWGTALGVLAAGLALSACGSAKRAAPTTAPRAISTTSAGSEPALARPVYPRCRFSSFRTLPPRQVSGPGGGLGWQLSYLPLPLSRARPGVTNDVLIVEQSPELPAIGVVHGHTISVGGQRVSIRAPTGKINVFEAQWNTQAARYVALANGNSPTVLEKFIGCLP